MYKHGAGLTGLLGTADLSHLVSIFILLHKMRVSNVCQSPWSLGMAWEEAKRLIDGASRARVSLSKHRRSTSSFT